MTTPSPEPPFSRGAARHPVPPAPIVRWVRDFGGVGPEGPDPLDAGVRALGAALAIAPEERRAAWALLAADALLTWAVEDAADAKDPGSELDRILRAAQRPGAGARPEAPSSGEQGHPG